MLPLFENASFLLLSNAILLQVMRGGSHSPQFLKSLCKIIHLTLRVCDFSPLHFFFHSIAIHFKKVVKIAFLECLVYI